MDFQHSLLLYYRSLIAALVTILRTTVCLHLGSGFFDHVYWAIFCDDAAVLSVSMRISMPTKYNANYRLTASHCCCSVPSYHLLMRHVPCLVLFNVYKLFFALVYKVW